MIEFIAKEIIPSIGKYNRQNPSPRYIELGEMYRHMHQHGQLDKNVPAEQTFDGRSLFAEVARIKQFMDTYKAKTVLDYGAGKGNQYKVALNNEAGERLFDSVQSFWGVDKIHCYDPGYAPFSKLPTEKFDAVISTDVLEHCPEEDIPWIMDEMFSYATKFAFANVACYPAAKHLPNGENAHCTIKRAEWWDAIVRNSLLAKHPNIAIYVNVIYQEIAPNGKATMTQQLLSYQT